MNNTMFKIIYKPLSQRAMRRAIVDRDRPCVRAVEGADYCDMRFNVKTLVKR